MMKKLLSQGGPVVKVAYRQAIVSFCPDLTSPTSKAVPVGVLLVAETEDGYFAALAGWRAGVVEADPLTQEFLNDLPEMLRRHVERAFASAGEDPTLDQILNRLHDSLRTSLSVTHMTPKKTEEIPLRALYPGLITRALDTLSDAAEVTATAPARRVHDRPPLSPFGHRPHRKSTSTKHVLPPDESRAWALAH